jgi:pentapeptide repeat protein
MTFRRLALALAAATALGSAFIHAQIPGRNVNMVSGKTLPDGDPFLQRQNEPSVAASTRNPLHLLAGANDYRTVDLPGLANSEETGDAWLGLFKSVDGGQRWTSTLIPGYPQDPLRSQSPLRFYGAAADPVVRAGTNGFIYYAGLAFNRQTNGSSAVFVARFIDDNNRERRDPFSYLGTSIVSSDAGTTGRLLDKPWIAVDIPRDNRTCPVTTTIIKPPAAPGGQPTTVTETHNLPAGPVYVAYAAFTGSGSTLKSDIMFQYSVNCGVTWSTPVRLSAADGSINQGVTIAIEPNTGAVTVAWRRFTKAGSTQTDAIMVAQSLTLGRLFTGALAIRKLPRLKSLFRVLESILEHRRQQGGVVIEELTEFDQGTAPSATNPDAVQFRTNVYPTMSWDDKGRLYVAWSERGFSTSPDLSRRDPLTGDAKIVMSSALLGLAWSAPKAVSETSTFGHQFMPSLAFAGGKLLLLYYDLREDVTQVFSNYIDDKQVAATGKRHTLDIRASLGTIGTLTPTFAPSVRVSDYFIGHRPIPNPENFVPCPTDALQLDCEQLQYNPPNLKMFKQGTVPFFGDYIDIQPAPAFVPSGRSWAYNTSRSAVPIFHAVWTDNRDVRPPADGNWTNYTPPNLEGTTSHISPIDGSTVACNPAGENFGSRNQNVYTARITGGLLVGSPGNTKPLSQTLQRGFVVFAQNLTSVLKTFRMQVASQPVGGFASFQQIFTQPVTFIDVIVPPRSTAARTLYVTSSDEHARVTVNVFEINQAGSGTPTPSGLTGNIILNADIENADIENADIENADIENADIENTELISADIENPSFRSADIENADIENADIENADIENADIENADIENADIENADIENTPFADAPKTDVTWSVTNTGNTTSAFNVNLFLSQNAPTSGVKTQLVLHKAYLTPAAASCDLKVRSHTVLVANITNPDFVTPTETIPDPNNPASNNATLYLGPGEKGYITLRLHDIDPTDNVIIINDKGEPISVDSHFVPGTTLAPVVVAQEIGTEDLNNGVTTPPITTTDGSTMFFLNQPTTSVAGVVMNPVRIQVRDQSGAVLPGVDVTLSLSSNPTETTLLGALTSTTDATGTAVFNSLQINTPGDGYRLRAVVSQGGTLLNIAPADSVPFSVRLVVLNTADSGPGSLRTAILLANLNAGVGDVITFAIPTIEGIPTITPSSPLPGLDDPVIIDATPTGVCTGGAPAVQIDGVNAGLSHGLVVNAPGSVIRGLSITGFASGFAGIFIGGGSGSTVECNYIGLTPFQALGPNYDGVRISGSANNVIGGNTAVSRNVISGNTNVGVAINGPTPDSSAGFILQTVVRNNFIGVDPAGTVIRGNGGNGIAITNAQLNTVAANVISGNSGEGIGIYGFRSTGNIIQGNYVGTNASGTAAIANTASGIYMRRAGQNSIVGNVVSGNTGFAGIAICGTPTFCGGGTDTGLSSDASGNVITGNIIGLTAAGTDPLRNAGYGVSLDGAPNTKVGGSAAGDGNVISSNGPAGVVIFGTGADGNLVRGNYIGTDVSGTLDRHNNGPGVTIPQGSNNIISGADAGVAPNVIMFNTGFGIHVGDASTNNKLRINRIDLNTDLGINLGTATVLPNDPGDLDSGANDGQNYPVLTSAQFNNGTLTLEGILNTDASHAYTIDVYASPTCDASGNGEGRQWIGSFVPAAVNVGFIHDFSTQLVAAGQSVTATATVGTHDPAAPETAGSTSEFSNCVTVTPGGTTTVGSVDDSPTDAIPLTDETGAPLTTPDLVSTTVQNTGSALLFHLRFAPGTFDAATTYAQLLLDTDRSAATGHPGINAGCETDSAAIGSEYLVNAQAGIGDIQQYAGSCNAFEFISDATVTNVANGYDITVPLAIINSNGTLNYKVAISRQLPSGFYSGVVDVAPDVGQPAATTGAAQTLGALGLDFVGGTVGYPVSLDTGRVPYGWQFNVRSAVAVNALGLWWDVAGMPTSPSINPGLAPIPDVHPVTLRTSTGTILVEVNVPSAATQVPSTQTTGHWIFVPITPVTLSPGSYAVEVQYCAAGNCGPCLNFPTAACGNEIPVRSGGTTTTVPEIEVVGSTIFGANLAVVR